MHESPPPMQSAQRKFFIIGIVLAVAIGAGLVLLDRSVRAETKFHEASLELAYQVKSPARAKPAALPQPEAPKATAPTAPTMQVLPPQ